MENVALELISKINLESYSNLQKDKYSIIGFMQISGKHVSNAFEHIHMQVIVLKRMEARLECHNENNSSQWGRRGPSG